MKKIFLIIVIVWGSATAMDDKMKKQQEEYDYLTQTLLREIEDGIICDFASTLDYDFNEELVGCGKCCVCLLKENMRKRLRKNLIYIRETKKYNAEIQKRDDEMKIRLLQHYLMLSHLSD